MNWRWKHIIICAVVGLIVGIAMAVSQSDILDLGTKIAIILVMPISINFLYWGWIKSGELLRKMNLFLVMSIGKWVIFFFVRLIISTLIGYVMFPIAIYKAIKNAE